MGGQGRKTIITYNSPKRYRKRCGLPKPLPLGEVSPKVTERASPAPKSRCAAIGRLFVRAIRSLCQSCLAAALPSQSGLRPPAPPKGEPLACRSAFVWTSEAQYLGNGSAPLSRPATALQGALVQKRLTSVARPALLRHVGPQASSAKWPGLPMAPLLRGAVASATERSCRGIAL